MIRKERSTLETTVRVGVAEESESESGLLSTRKSSISTGIGFFDHMLDLLSFHAGLYFEIEAEGDLHVDGHHTVEDIGITLGQILYELYKSKTSYARYGFFYLPMDESLARVALDLSGRPHLSFVAKFSSEKVGEFDTELVQEFFQALAMNARMTLHIDLLKGGNTHHEIEAIFKAVGRSLRIALESREGAVPSTKGVIE